MTMLADSSSSRACFQSFIRWPARYTRHDEFPIVLQITRTRQSASYISIEHSRRTYLVKGLVRGQREIFETLRVEFFTESARLQLGVVVCQSCGPSKVIGTEIHHVDRRGHLPGLG